MTMRSIEEFPPADYPLMEKLPALKAETVANLRGWFIVQAGVSEPNELWLTERQRLYREKFPPPRIVSLPEFNEWANSWLAAAALDLLRWRTGSKDNRDAVEHFNTPMTNQPRTKRRKDIL